MSGPMIALRAHTRHNAPVQRRAAQRTVRCNRLLDGRSEFYRRFCLSSHVKRSARSYAGSQALWGTPGSSVY